MLKAIPMTKRIKYTIIAIQVLMVLATIWQYVGYFSTRVVTIRVF